MTILKDRNGNPQGVIREGTRGMERLLDLGGKIVAHIDRTPIGRTTRMAFASVPAIGLAGMVGDEE
jgi:hypothetical protein